MGHPILTDEWWAEKMEPRRCATAGCREFRRGHLGSDRCRDCDEIFLSPVRIEEDRCDT